MADSESKRTSLTDSAYEYIKQKILDCEYVPGQPIYEKKIAEVLQMGRTPVREALIRLQNEKLVNIFPRKGMCASHISKQDVTELYQLRKLLDVQVAIQYVSGINKPALLEYETRFLNSSTISEKEFYTLDIEFHTFFITSAQNDRLTGFYRELMQLQYRVGLYSMVKKHSNSRERTIWEHQQMIRAMLTENPEQIEQAFIQHLNSSLLAVIDSLSET